MNEIETTFVGRATLNCFEGTSVIVSVTDMKVYS